MATTSLALVWLVLGQAPSYAPATPRTTTAPAIINQFSQPAARGATAPQEYQPPGNFTAPANAAPTQPSVANPYATAQPASPPARSPAGEWLAEELRRSQELRLLGQPMNLAQVIGRATDRARQLEAVRGYWRLWATAMTYRIAWDERRWFEASGPAANVSSSNAGVDLATEAWTAELAAASARVRESQLTFLAAQHELAERIKLGNELPIASDSPHVGDYQTYYDRIYQGRAPQPRVRLMHAVMPLQKDALAARASAVWAASDAVQTATEAYRARQTDAETLRACHAEFVKQRRLMIEAIRVYNDDIAEYALATAPEGATPTALVAMMIKPVAPPAAAPGVARPNSAAIIPSPGVEPAAFADPAGGEATLADSVSPITPAATPPKLESPPAWNGDVSSLDEVFGRAAAEMGAGATTVEVAPAAPPADRFASPPARYSINAVAPASTEPTTGAPPAAAGPAPRFVPTQPPVSPATTSEPSGAVLEPPRGNPLRFGAPPVIDGPSARSVPVMPGVDGTRAMRHTVARMAVVGPTTSPSANRAPNASAAASLASLPPRLQAQEIVLRLYSSLDNGPHLRPLALAEALSASRGGERNARILAYWRTSELLARRECLAERVRTLDQLTAVAVSARTQAGGDAALLRLQMARRVATADLVAMEPTIARGRFTLTELVSRSAAGDWVTPTTAPHGGGYQLAGNSAPASVTRSPQVMRASVAIEGLHAAIVDRGQAVRATGDLRNAAVAAAQKSPSQLDRAIRAILNESNQKLDLCAVVTQYNAEIAEYALAVLGPQTSHERLAGALVVPRLDVANRPAIQIGQRP